MVEWYLVFICTDIGSVLLRDHKSSNETKFVFVKFVFCQRLNLQLRHDCLNLRHARKVSCLFKEVSSVSRRENYNNTLYLSKNRHRF